MKLIYPLISPYIINQGFGETFNEYYKLKGLLGHSGIDLFSKNKTVFSAHDGVVYSTLNKNNPDPMKYRAVYTIVNDGIDYYELVYGHLDTIYVNEGERIPTGVAIGKMGNTGTVYSGGRLITKEEKLAGSTAGAHLHFQKRKLVRTQKDLRGHQYLIGSNGIIYRDKDSYCYLVPDFENGYNGCSDPKEDFYTPTLLEKIKIVWGVLRYLQSKGRV